MITGSAKVDSKGNSRFSIEWSELLQVVRDATFKRTATDLKLARNRQRITGEYTRPGAWEGYSESDLKSWIDKGFRADGLGVDLMPPVREKRRYVYREDADELHIDRALSGEDNYAGEFTKRVIIPGMRVKIETGFSAATPAKIVNAYNVFACQCIQSLEESGIDCEIVFEEYATGMVDGFSGNTSTEIRVKRMNENVDFASYSAFLSPASFRTFYFTAMTIHADKLGKNASYGLGRCVNMNKPWDVKMSDDGELVFTCPYMPSGEFPKSNMLSKFRQALRLTD